jgi:hypothetical protein
MISEHVKAFAQRPSLTVAARGVLPVAGRDEETVFPFGRTKKLTKEGRQGSVPSDFLCVQRTAWSCHGVPRATTALTKMTSFLAQATSATL